MDQKEIVVMKQLAGIVQSLALRQGISRDDALMSDLRHVEYQLDSLMFSARHPTIAEWNINPIQLECGLLVAPSDFILVSEGDEKQEFFSREEAHELIAPALKDTKWHIPSRRDIEQVISELQGEIWRTLNLRGGGFVFYNNWQNRDKGITVSGHGPHYLIEPNEDERRIYRFKSEEPSMALCRGYDGEPTISQSFVHACGFRVRCVSGQAE